MPNIKGGAAVPVALSSANVEGMMAIPVYGFVLATLDRNVLGGPSQPVRILTDADLIQNGGRYRLVGDPSALPVFIPTDGRNVMGGPAIAIYPLNPAGTWPTPVVDVSQLLLEDGPFLLLEDGVSTLLLEP